MKKILLPALLLIGILAAGCHSAAPEEGPATQETLPGAGGGPGAGPGGGGRDPRDPPITNPGTPPANR
jgi:hypothetical protein